MAVNNVVCRYRSGEVIRGFTQDFSPHKKIFHLHTSDGPGEVIDVDTSQLKAVFFVKSREGDRGYQDRLWVPDPLPGTKIVVEFFDREVISGVTPGYSHNRTGFFITPLDPDSNNERIYVIAGAVRKVLVGDKAEKFLEELSERESR